MNRFRGQPTGTLILARAHRQLAEGGYKLQL